MRDFHQFSAGALISKFLSLWGAYQIEAAIQSRLLFGHVQQFIAGSYRNQLFSWFADVILHAKTNRVKVIRAN